MGLQDHGSRELDRGSWTQDPGSQILNPGSWTQDPESWTPCPGSRIKGPGSWIQDLRFQIQTPTPHWLLSIADIHVIANGVQSRRFRLLKPEVRDVDEEAGDVVDPYSQYDEGEEAACVLVIFYIDELAPPGTQGSRDSDSCGCREVFLQNLPVQDYSEEDLHDWLATFSQDPDAAKATFFKDFSDVLTG